MNAYLADKELLRQCTLATLELFKLCQLRGVDLKKFPEASFVNFPVWLVTMLVRWNIKRQESAQRYTAHAGSEGSLQETRAYFVKMMKTADEFGFEMPNLKALGIYLKVRSTTPIHLTSTILSRGGGVFLLHGIHFRYQILYWRKHPCFEKFLSIAVLLRLFYM